MECVRNTPACETFTVACTSADVLIRPQDREDIEIVVNAVGRFEEIANEVNIVGGKLTVPDRPMAYVTTAGDGYVAGRRIITACEDLEIDNVRGTVTAGGVEVDPVAAGSLEIEIRLPSWVDLRVKTVGGGIRHHGIPLGNGMLRTVAGTIELDGANGRIEAETTSGAIRIGSDGGALTGVAKLSSTVGDISVRLNRPKMVRARTVVGDIEVDGKYDSAVVDCHSDVGDVNYDRH